MNINNKQNEYQKNYPNFDRTPKTVIGAVAFSLALRICDDDYTAAKILISDEWKALHTTGIVPQKHLK